LDVSVELLTFEAARPSINYFYASFVFLLEKDVLWLKVAMDNFMLFEKLQALQCLNGYPSDQVKVQAIEFVKLKKLIEIDVEKLKDETSMTSEEKSVFQLHNIGSKLRIMHDNIFQNFDLYFCLLVELGLISNDLQSDHLFLLMVKSLENLAKRAVSQPTDHFISICNGISSCNSSLTCGISEVLDTVDPSRTDIKYFIAKHLLFLELSQERVFFYLLRLSDLYSAAAFIRRFMFYLVGIVNKLNR